MPLADIRIDDTTWDAASAERRTEFRQALNDLLETHQIEASEPLKLLISVDGGNVVLDARALDGATFTRIDLPFQSLSPHFKEYFDICRDMGKVTESVHSPRLEALDIAKRLAHDEAAETLLRLCSPLRPDHATCRRLFTLLVTLHFDTTRLLLPHHRR